MESKSESKSEDRAGEKGWGCAKEEEAKGSKEEAAELPEMDVSSIEVPSDPEDGSSCPLEGALSIKIRFASPVYVGHSHWVVKLLVDCANERLIKILGETETEVLDKGESVMSFSTPAIDFSGFKKSQLANAGLLMAGLVVGGEEVCTVNMVVNVVKERDGSLVRQILNPLA